MKRKVWGLLTILALSFGCSMAIVPEEVWADGYDDCISRSGGRGGIDSVRWACDAYYYVPGSWQTACALWLGPYDSSTTQSITATVTSTDTSITIAYWGMCTNYAIDAVDVSVSGDNDSISGRSTVGRGGWGDPDRTSTSLNVGKFISGVTPSSSGGVDSYTRSVSIYRCNAENTSSCSSQSVSITINVIQRRTLSATAVDTDGNAIGSDPDSATVNNSTTATITAKKITGYTFKCWSSNNNTSCDLGTGMSYSRTMNSDVHVYAVYEKNRYSARAVGEGLATADTGWQNASTTKSADANCTVDGCAVEYRLYLRRDFQKRDDYQVETATNYTVYRTANFETAETTVESGTFDSTTATQIGETHKEVLKPGQVVCYYIRFNSVIETNDMADVKACISVLGSAQPDDPSSDPEEDPDGEIIETDDDIFLDMKVKNISKDIPEKYTTYQKAVYAKPGDEVTYGATYHPLLQYTYTLRAERIRLDGGTAYPESGKNTASTLSTLLKNNFNKTWNNDFAVYGANFTPTSSGLGAHNQKNGDTTKVGFSGSDINGNPYENTYKVQAADAGKSLTEYAQTNSDKYSSTQTTPSQIKFSNIGGYNTANIITTQVTRSAFVRVPYNFKTTIEIKDNSEVIYAGEDKTISYEIGVNPKTNSTTTDGSEEKAYATKTGAVTRKTVAYLKKAASNVNETTSTIYPSGQGTSSRDFNLCSYFGYSGTDETKCGYAENTGEDGTGEALNVNKNTFDATLYAQDLAAGTEVCVATAVYPATSGLNTNWNDPDGDHKWNISASKCYKIAKKPSVEVWGGSVVTAGGISTAASQKYVIQGFDDAGYTVAGGTGDGGDTGNKTYRVFGSWGELGVMAGGTIKNFSSGANLGFVSNANGTLAPDATAGANTGDPGGGAKINMCVRSPLTIQFNCNTSSGFGGAVANKELAKEDRGGILKKMEKAKQGALANNELGLSTEGISGNGTYYYEQATVGNLAITGGTTVYVKSSEDIAINGPIMYAGLYSNSAGIPKMIIYAEKDINIDCGVSRVDAILIADGTVNTCADSEGRTPEENIGARSNQLIINGAIVANKVEFNRTYGAATGANSIVPAEIINYDSTLYAWGTEETDLSETDSLDMTYIRELSPRY